MFDIRLRFRLRLRLRFERGLGLGIGGGRRVAALDLAVEPLDAAAGKADPAGLRLVALAVPMHTALHIGVRAAR